MTNPTVEPPFSKIGNFLAKTLHSALGIKKGKAPSNLVVGKKLVLIDEFSMTDSVLMAQVFDGLKHNKDYRLVFIGDEFQLPSVGPGNLLHLFIKRLSHQFVNPKKIGSVPRIVDVALIQKLKEPSLSIKDIVQSIANSNQVDLFAWTLKATKNHKSVIAYQKQK